MIYRRAVYRDRFRKGLVKWMLGLLRLRHSPGT